MYLCSMMNYLMSSLFGIGYYSPRSLKSMSKKEINRVVYLSIWYCRYVLGENKRRDIPKVRVRKNKVNNDYYGEYCPTDNEIRVFTNEVRTLGQLTSTIIHEYTHYLQPIASKYYKLLKEHGYDNHPFEIEARDNEWAYNRKLLNYIRENF